MLFFYKKFIILNFYSFLINIKIITKLKIIQYDNILDGQLNKANQFYFCMDNCTLSCIQIQGNLNFDDMCSYTRQECQQDTVQFIQLYYCIFHGSFMILIFVGIPFFLLLFKTLNVIASEYLSPCVEVFIQEFNISPTLAGVTFLAFANGAPDVMTAIIAGSSDSSTTAMIPFGSIFGACLFSTAFIFSTVIFSQPNQLITLKVGQFVLPLSFYIISILFIIAVTTIYGKMNLYLACVLLIIYIIYIILVVKSQRNLKKTSLLDDAGEIDNTIEYSSSIISNNSQKDNFDKQEDLNIDNQKQIVQKKGLFDSINDKIQFVENFIFKRLIPFYKIQQWNPTNTLISLIVSPFIIAATQQMPWIFKVFMGPIPVFLLISLPSIFLLIYTVYCILQKMEPKYTKVFTIYSFLVSISALTVVCSILVNFVELIQLLTGVNSVFLGLTVFAWANSIGDYLTIVHFAKNGNPKTAIAGVFSGQLFNFSLGFGVSLIIQSLDGPYEYKIFDFQGTTYDKISDAIVMTVIFGGLFYLMYLLVIAIRKKGVFMKKQALFGRWYYIGFLLLSCILAVLTDFFSQILCDL